MDKLAFAVMGGIAAVALYWMWTRGVVGRPPKEYDDYAPGPDPALELYDIRSY
jgi:hypothetical protein